MYPTYWRSGAPGHDEDSEISLDTQAGAAQTSNAPGPIPPQPEDDLT